MALGGGNGCAAPNRAYREEAAAALLRAAKLGGDLSRYHGAWIEAIVQAIRVETDRSESAGNR